MKQEAAKKKSKLFLWIAIAAVLVAVGVLLAIFLPGRSGGETTEPTVETSSKIYWNVDRLQYIDEETGLPVRKAGEDGLFHILFTVDGEQVELTCADRKLVNKLDAVDLMGLVLDANGQIIDMIKIDDMVDKIAKGAFVQRVEEGSFTTNTSVALNGMELKYNITEETKIYDVAPTAEKIGAPGKVGVMDKVTVLQDAEGTVTHVFILERALESRVYWRLDTQLYDSKAGVSTRPKDADGFVTYHFFVDGQYVTLRTDRQDCINAIDYYGNNSCALGLFFDENGIIVDVCNGGRASKGVIAASNYIVTAVNGNDFKTEVMTGANLGKTYDGTITENTKIYDMTGTSDKPGLEVKELKLKDQILVITNADGEVLYIFITRRRVDAPVYLVMTGRAYNTATGETTQKPDDEGWYVFNVVAETKRMTVRTKDKEIANQMHAPVGRHIGLRLKGDEIIGTYHAGNVTGGHEYALYEYVLTMNGNIITTQLGGGKTSINTAVVAEDCEIYLIGFESSVPIKKVKELQLHDRLMAMKNEKGEISYIYILERKMDLPVYWNVGGRMYDSVKKETTRVPDADGYYVFNVTTQGKRPFDVKTKDKNLANLMDKFAAPQFTLKVDKNGIVQEVYHPYAGVGGAVVGSYYVVKSIKGREVELYRTSTGETASFTMLENCRCYNVSAGGAEVFRGEKTTLKVGDKVQSLTNYYGRNEVELIFVVERPNPKAQVGWKLDRKYNGTTKETTRVPDAEGYYVYQVAVKGELKTYKTKDKEVANFMDSQSTAVAMNVKGDIIQRAYIPYYTDFYGLIRASYYSVTKIEGNKLYTANTAGDTMELTLAKNYECYDVSTYAEKFGAKAQVKVGDRVIAWLDNADKEASLLYIVYAYNRETDMNKPCPHCGKVVMWVPYAGTVGTGHYFMPSDYNGGQISVGADSKGNPYDFVLDMNSHDLTSSNGKALLVHKGGKAYIYDSTGYDFTVKGYGSKDSTHSGVIQMIDGELTLVGGNYVFDDSKNQVVFGGVMTTWAPQSKINATGVDFIGGTLVEHKPAEGVAKKDNKGGTISFGGGVANFNDCTFVGGVNPTGNGGNLFIGADTKVNFNGCTIRGGEALRGGAIAIMNGAKGNVTMTDTLITDGKAKESGAGVFVYNGTATFGAGTKITDNMLKSYAPANFWVSGASSKVVFDGVNITGAAQYSNGELTISGNTVIEKTTACPYGLKVADGMLVNMGELGDIAKLGITANGIFTNTGDVETFAAYIESGKIYSDDALLPVCIKDDALAVGVFRCINGHIDHEGVECAEPIVAWRYWTEENAKAALGSTGNYKTQLTNLGNWILLEDVVMSGARANGAGTLRIDLNGHNVIRVVTEGSQTRVFSVDNAKGTIEITDLSTEGEPGCVRAEIPEGVTPGYTYGTLFHGNTGSMKLAGRAVLDASNQSTTGAFAPIQMNGGLSFTMYGGTIKGMAATGATGSAIHGWGNSSVAIYGGEIISVATEKAVYAPGNFTMTNDAVINGNVDFGGSAASTGVIDISGNAAINGTAKVVGATSVTVSENAKITSLQLTNGEKLTLGELGENAKVAVDATGIFTEAGDANVLQGYLDNKQVVGADEDMMLLSVQENALHIERIEIRYCLKGHTEHTGENADCTLEILQWQTWRNNKALPTSGNYILKTDVEISETVANTGNLMLDLNGHNITRTITAAAANTNVFANNTAILAITDTSDEPGTVKTVMDYAYDYHTSGTSGAVINSSGSNTVILAGGIIDGSALRTNHTGGATISINGYFKMYGGVIKGAQTKNNGSAIAAFGSSTVEIHGGEIIGGTASNGGAIYANGVFTMTDGYIHGGKATTAGDNLWTNSADKSVITISGGTIEGGFQPAAFKTLTLSGDVKIVKAQGGSAYSLKLAPSQKPTFVNLSGDAKIGLMGTYGYLVSTVGSTAELAKYVAEGTIYSEQETALVIYNGQLYQPKRDEIYSCINGHSAHGGSVTCPETIVTWKLWNAANAQTEFAGYTEKYAQGDETRRLPGTGNWILTGDVTMSGARANGGGTLRINLNGHNVTRVVTEGGQTRVFSVDNSKGTIEITDLSTEGEPGCVRAEIPAGVTPGYTYGTLFHGNTGSMKLAGRAVLDASNQSTTGAFAPIQMNGGLSFTMYGGTIKGMAATGATGSAIHGWGNSSIAIYGGEIISVATEKAVYAPGNFTMTNDAVINGDVDFGASAASTGVISISGNATINGTAKVVGASSITVSGNAVITKLENNSGKEVVKQNFTGTIG